MKLPFTSDPTTGLYVGSLPPPAKMESPLILTTCHLNGDPLRVVLDRCARGAQWLSARIRGFLTACIVLRITIELRLG